MRLSARIALSAAFVLPASLSAQAAPPILGKWTIEWESGRRIENGDVTVVKSTGEIEVVASGDSLLATVTAKSRTDGAPLPKPFTMGGRITVAGGVFNQASVVTINMNGEAKEQKITSKWSLSAEGDNLQGSISRDMPGGMMIQMEPAVVTGKRAK